MSTSRSISSFFDRLITVPSTDPDDSRRRRLLNIILVGVIVLSILAFIVNGTLLLTGSRSRENINLEWIIAGMFAGSVLIYYLNRKFSGIMASAIFLVLFLVVISASDTYPALVDGRSLLYFTIPITMASMLMGPPYSFAVALLSTIEIFILGKLGNTEPNLLAIFGYLLLALVSWLSSRSLEQALKDLRVLNAELDRRVEERTRELSEALSRELVEAGKTQAILEGIADGVLVFDQDEKVIVANPALSRLLGMPLEALLEQDMESLSQNKAIAREDRGHLQNRLQNPSKVSNAVRIRWNEKTLSVNAAPVSSGGDQIYIFGTVAVFRDFTREAEVERMKNSFVAMVSHELRTPLNAVLAYSEMLRDAVFGSLNEKQFSATNRIFVNSQRLLNIVSDLLDQAQIEAGRLKIQWTEFHTAELMENMRSVMEKPTQDKGLYLSTEITPEVPQTIVGDAHRIQQIMVNLVNNAVKFTREGGINVRIFCPSEDTWAIAVRDTGPGIPLGDQTYVFEPFRQVEGITTREHGGIGLGLSIVKRLSILMGGDISLESAVGKGSTFTVTLPLHPIQKEEIQ